MTDRVQGGDEGGRSQGRPDRDRRGLEQEEPSRAQATGMTATPGGADRGRSHDGERAYDSRGLTNGGRAEGGEPMSQADEEDLEDHGRIGG